MYVQVEAPRRPIAPLPNSVVETNSETPTANHSNTISGPSEAITSSSLDAAASKRSNSPGDDFMQLDNTAHKVYIYNLDDELSSSDESSPPSSPRMSMDKISFHPHLASHLLSTRIPPQIRANADGEVAGVNLHNELILYGVPSSLSVPEEKDSVRKAIIETRARARGEQRKERERARTAPVDISQLGSSTGNGERGADNITMINTVSEMVQEPAIADVDAMDID